MWQTVRVETLMLPCSFWSFLLDIFGIVQRCNSLPFSLTGCSAISSLFVVLCLSFWVFWVRLKFSALRIRLRTGRKLRWLCNSFPVWMPSFDWVNMCRAIRDHEVQLHTSGVRWQNDMHSYSSHNLIQRLSPYDLNPWWDLGVLLEHIFLG